MVRHLVLVPQGGRYNGILVVVDQHAPLLGAHGHLPMAARPVFSRTFLKEGIGSLRLDVRTLGLVGGSCRRDLSRKASVKTRSCS